MKKTLFSLGALSVAIIPIATVISCSDGKKGEIKVDIFESELKADEFAQIITTKKPKAENTIDQSIKLYDYDQLVNDFKITNFSDENKSLLFSILPLNFDNIGNNKDKVFFYQTFTKGDFQKLKEINEKNMTPQEVIKESLKIASKLNQGVIKTKDVENKPELEDTLKGKITGQLMYGKIFANLIDKLKNNSYLEVDNEKPTLEQGKAYTISEINLDLDEKLTKSINAELKVKLSSNPSSNLPNDITTFNFYVLYKDKLYKLDALPLSLKYTK